MNAVRAAVNDDPERPGPERLRAARCEAPPPLQQQAASDDNKAMGMMEKSRANREIPPTYRCTRYASETADEGGDKHGERLHGRDVDA
jgi:hypothetical protein